MDTRQLPTGVVIRAIDPADTPALRRFYEGLSQDSIDARFHGAMRGIPEELALAFCGPDHLRREGLVAVAAGSDGTETVVGHLCLEPAPEGDREIAVAVADAWQHLGIGHALVLSGIDWCRAHGSRRVRAAIRWSNPAIMGLLRSVGRPVTVHSTADGDLVASLDIAGELSAAA